MSGYWKGRVDPELAEIRAQMRARVLPPGLGLPPFASRVEIPDGDKGTVKTLQLAGDLVAASLADPAFPLFVRRKLVVEPGTNPRDILSVFSNAFDYVQGNVGYQTDPLARGADVDTISDYVQSPHWTLFVDGVGDCLSHASALNAFAASLGRGFGYRFIKADPSDPDRFSHVYPILGFKGPDGREHWIPADTSTEGYQLGDEPAALSSFKAHDYIVAPAT